MVEPRLCRTKPSVERYAAVAPAVDVGTARLVVQQDVDSWPRRGHAGLPDAVLELLGVGPEAAVAADQP